jgi:transposase
MGTHGENSREYKFEMMRLHQEEGISIKVLSEQFGVPQATLFGWRTQYRKYGGDAFVGCGQQRPGDAELRKLRKENEELKMQVEILKKAAAYQAREKSKRK